MGAKKSKVNVQQGGLESTFSGGLDPKKVFPPSGNFEWLSKEYLQHSVFRKSKKPLGVLWSACHCLGCAEPLRATSMPNIAALGSLGTAWVLDIAAQGRTRTPKVAECRSRLLRAAQACKSASQPGIRSI